MIPNWNKILKEWSYRVGVIKLNNSEHLYHLNNILEERGWPHEVITEVIGNLREKVGKVYLKGKSAPAGIDVQTGPRGGKYYMGNPETGEPEKPSGIKPKTKKLSKVQQAERDRIDALKIHQKLSDAKTPKDEGKVVSEIVDNEHQEILDGNYGPGGGAASYGEMNYSEATNGFANGEPTPLGVKPSKPEPTKEHKKRYSQGNQKKKRIAYAQELGINPYDDNNPKQQESIVNELARRETWVDQQMEKHQGTKVKDQHFKTKKDEESQREWLRVGFDGGRSTIEDLRNDPDYGGLSDNPEHPKPKSMLMSKASQEMVKDLLEKKLKECGDLKNPQQRTDCEKHYNEQIKNFEKGLDDHDTGTVYYDKDGRLRFLNTSNKKSKSMKDPHNNSTAETRIPTVVAAMAEISDSGDYPNMDAKQVAKKVNDAQETATKMSVNASKNVMLGNGKDGKPSKTPIKTTQGDSSGKGTNSGGLGIVAKRLPAKKAYQDEPGYFNKAKNHKKTQAKLKELYPDTPEGEYSDEQALVAIMEINKSGNGSWKPHGKFINKMGQMYNQVNGRYNELKEKGMTEDEIYAQIAEESDGVYTAEELKQIRESENLQEAGRLNENYKRAMTNAHEEVVSGAKDADEEYWKENGPAPINDITGEPENGPHVRGYVKSWMKGMHWDSYIDNLDGKKNIQIGGINCKPEDFRNCLADQSGIDSEPNPKPNKEWRNNLQEHLEKNIQIDADSNAVNLKGKEENKTSKLGEDTWRSAGDAKKIAGHIGDDMINCIKESVSNRKSSHRKPK